MCSRQKSISVQTEKTLLFNYIMLKQKLNWEKQFNFCKNKKRKIINKLNQANPHYIN